MAKTRAQRKAERRRRAAQQSRESDVAAQQRTQVPESADVVEAELAERGADLDSLTDEPERAPTEAQPSTPEPVAPPEPLPEETELPEPPAPSRADVGVPGAEDRISRRARRRQERERRDRAKESARRRERAEPQETRTRGPIVGFILSCWAELKRVQWPTRETLIQASAVTVLFIAIAAAYLGALDAIFNWVVKRIL
jgi:preprotein translocase SecE subunit